MKLSIITINYNNKDGLLQTIRSVFAQKFTDYEYIIIDGGSTDGSKEYLEQFTDKFSYVTSEKDNGIYHAMNKGIVRANGDYIMFLNSGDYLMNNEIIAELFKNGNNADIVYGDILLEKQGIKTKWQLPEKLFFSFFFHSSLSHSCNLIKRSLFKRIGLYTERYKIISDWEFFLLAIHKYQCSYQYVSITLGVFNMEGISNKEENRKLIIEEKKEVLNKYFGSFLPEYEENLKLKKELQKIKSLFAYRLYNKFDKIVKKRVSK